MVVFHDGLGRVHCGSRRRRAGEAQCAGAGGGAGARRRQRERDRRDRRHRRVHSRPRSGTGDAADQCHGGRHVDRHAAGRGAGQSLRSPLRAADRFAVWHPLRHRLVACDGAGIVPAHAFRRAVRRALCRCASVVPLCCRRHRKRTFPPQGRVLGFGRRCFCRRDRAAACRWTRGRLISSPELIWRNRLARCSPPSRWCF